MNKHTNQEILRRKKQHQNFAIFIKVFIAFCMIAGLTLIIGGFYFGISLFNNSSQTSNKETTYRVCLEAGKDIPNANLESITKTCDEAIEKLYKDKN